MKQTNTFKKTVKKLKHNEKVDLDKAVKALLADPLVGTLKSGDLGFVRVYKFRMNKQLALLAYEYDEEVLTLILMDLGAHENFYRDLKRKLH